MSYRRYTRKEFDAIKTQHNIMILVGNGFDLEIMKNFHKSAKTSYENFYHFLEYHECRKENMIFKKMKEEKEKNHQLWSDFELALISLLDEKVSVDELKEDFLEIQEYFSRFLNDIIKPELLAEIGKRSEKYSWAKRSLSEFLGDLSEEDYKTIRFPAGTEYYDMFNFVILNFNYTALLDDYLYLDKKQFEPHPYQVADRNFIFKPNPKNYDSVEHKFKDKEWVSYIMTDIIHPHGVQNVPRSILFGFNDEHQVKCCGKNEQYFMKPYWGQNDVRYKHYFKGTELYIIFGLSIGKTDKWWWQYIVYSLRYEKSELIIYMYQSKDKPLSTEDVKAKFITESGVQLTRDDWEKVSGRIFVVLFDENTERVFLNSKETEE